MVILNAQQIKEWDRYTMLHEPISSIDLMERAASKCCEWILKQDWNYRSISVFCGKGNNGGDGLAIARLLFFEGFRVQVFILEFGKKGSEDFQINLQKLQELPIPIHFLQEKESFPNLSPDEIIIEALYGLGLNKPLEGLSLELVNHINDQKAVIVSIDIPAGLFIDRSSKGNGIIKASFTLTFQCYKPALLVQENASFIGYVIVLDIGLNKDFLKNSQFDLYLIDTVITKSIFHKRDRFAHKGIYGHALLIGGSFGKMGAAIIMAKACLQSGAGLVTCVIPSCGYFIMQTAVPEAMVITDHNEHFITQLPEEADKYSVIGIGPGIGKESETQNLVSFLIRRFNKPLVIDADGLNCIALQKDLLDHLPEGSILTPHPKEFDRLFGDHFSDFDRIEKAKQKARELKIIIVLKGHHTFIATPSGISYFNNTGNAGMAKGGSGDALTGIITAFVSQKYTPVDAAMLGVYMHGLAGDFAASTHSMESMTATDIISSLGNAFREFY